MRYKPYDPHDREFRLDDICPNGEMRIGLSNNAAGAVFGFASDEHAPRAVYTNSQIICDGCNCYRSEFEFGGYVAVITDGQRTGNRLQFDRCRVCRNRAKN